MAGNFDELLSSLGFGAADAAAQEGLISRKADLAKGNVDLQAYDDRLGLNANLEGRGVLNSGEGLLRNARLELGVANQKSQIDVAAADDYLSMQRGLEQSQAQKDAQDRQFNLQVELANRQYEMQKRQIQAQTEAQRRADEAQYGRNW